MWIFDLAKTKAGQELISMTKEKWKKRTILEEIGRIKTMKSKGVLTDSLYEEFIGPLEKIDNVRDRRHAGFRASRNRSLRDFLTIRFSCLYCGNDLRPPDVALDGSRIQESVV